MKIVVPLLACQYVEELCASYPGELPVNVPMPSKISARLNSIRDKGGGMKIRKQRQRWKI